MVLFHWNNSDVQPELLYFCPVEDGMLCWTWSFSQCEVELPIIPHFINLVVQHYYGTQCHCFDFLWPLISVICMEKGLIPFRTVEGSGQGDIHCGNWIKRVDRLLWKKSGARWTFHFCKLFLPEESLDGELWNDYVQKCLTLENKTNRNVSDEAWGSYEAILAALQESWTLS